MDTSSLQLISEIGTRLAQQTLPKKRKKFDEIIDSLRKAANALSELEQSTEPETAEEAQAMKKRQVALKRLINAVVHRGLLRHEDKDVKLLVATCVTELFRVMAPKPPFEEKHLTDVFKLIIGVIADLADTADPLFSKRVKVLNTVAQLNCCVLMPEEIDCTDLVLKMFNVFFSVVRDNHDDRLFKDMSSMMRNILNSNCRDASQKPLEVILQNLIKPKKGATLGSYELAKSVITTCAEVDDKLNSLVWEFIASCIYGKCAVTAVDCGIKECYHDIIFEIFQCAPHMLLPIINGLIEELRSKQDDVREKAVKLVGKVFAILEQHVAQEFHDLFTEFLIRFCDKSVHVRIGALQCIKAIYALNPFRSESHEIITSVEDRLLDPTAQVRMHAVIVACDIFSSNLKLVPKTLLAQAISRLQDPKISVRKKALQKLMEVYQDYCNKCSEGSMAISDHFEEIPCEILKLCRNNNCEELRPQRMELILADNLFPDHLSVMERTNHWIHMFSLFRDPHKKALITVFYHKRRFQEEMKNYLAILKRSKDICAEETQNEIESVFAKLATYFSNSLKAKWCLHELNRIKDNNLFKSLERLLDEPTFTNGQTIKVELLEMVGGDKNPNYDFMDELFSKCSSNIFSSEHVQCILDYRSSGEDRLKDSSETLLAAIRIPISVLKAFEKQIPSMPKDSETQFQTLEHTGPVKSEQHIDQSSNLQPNFPNQDQLPIFMLPFIENVIDVDGDGHCGFRAVAILLDRHEDSYPEIRAELLYELQNNRVFYTDMFKEDRFKQVEHTLLCNWMTMPDTGFLIAQAYHCVVVLLSKLGFSETYFPLHGEPKDPEKLICLGYVNDNHFMRIDLKDGCPIPTTSVLWEQHRDEDASTWPDKYYHRMTEYNILRHDHDVEITGVVFLPEYEKVFIDLQKDEEGDVIVVEDKNVEDLASN